MSSNNDYNSSNNDRIIMRRSTFNKIIILSVAALMVSAFFGGYILRGNIGGEGGTLSSALTNAAILQQLQQQQQSSPSQPAPTAGQQQQPPQTKIQSVSLDDGDPIKGKEDAPVTLIEFADFQCPFCGRYASDTFPQIEKEYVSTGKVKYVYKDFPLDFHPNAKSSAIAAECANEQGKFWQYHDALFKNQPQWENQDGNTNSITFKKYATDLGLNAVSFGSCFDSKKYEAAINEDTQLGTTYGVSGTPTFYIGNDKNGYTQIVGAQPFSAFKRTIDQVLANSGSNSGNGGGSNVGVAGST